MKYLALAAATALLAVAPATARPGADNPTATHDNPSSCLGAERATRNSAGGDREHGAFGHAQSDFVAQINAGDFEEWGSYGEFLREYLASCENAPGGGDDE